MHGPTSYRCSVQTSSRNDDSVFPIRAPDIAMTFALLPRDSGMNIGTLFLTVLHRLLSWTDHPFVLDYHVMPDYFRFHSTTQTHRVWWDSCGRISCSLDENMESKRACTYPLMQLFVNSTHSQMYMQHVRARCTTIAIIYAHIYI